MAGRHLLRRGNKASLPTLAEGEPGFALDTKELFIGATGGNVAIWTNAASSSSFGANGYQKLPSGLIIQWGIDTIIMTNAEGKKIVTFPLAFPTACLYSACGITGVDGNPEDIAYNYTTHTNANNTTITLYVKNIVNTFGTAAGISWVAIGN